MPLNRSITLKVSPSREFGVSMCILELLLVVAALISPYPVILTLSCVLLFAAERAAKFSNLKSGQLTSVIFADGRVRLKSNQREIIEGTLEGRQWCTRWLVILRMSNAGNNPHRLLVLTTHGQGKDDLRRLKVWLRQDLFNNTVTKSGVGLFAR